MVAPLEVVYEGGGKGRERESEREVWNERIRPHLLKEQGIEGVAYERVPRIKCAVDVDSLGGHDAFKVNRTLDRHVLPRGLAHVALKHMPPVGFPLMPRNLGREKLDVVWTRLAGARAGERGCGMIRWEPGLC